MRSHRAPYRRHVDEFEPDYAQEAIELARLAQDEGASGLFAWAKAGLGALPGGALLAEVVERARLKAARDFAGDVLGVVAPEQLGASLLAEPQVVGLYLRASAAAALSGSEAKRRLLARVVTAAVLDDALVDEAALVILALEDLEPPHLRTLEAISRVFSDPRSDDGQGGLRGLTRQEERIYEAVGDVPTPVPLALERQGLIVRIEAGPYSSRRGGAAWERCRITTFGETVLRYLHDVDQGPSGNGEGP